MFTSSSANDADQQQSTSAIVPVAMALVSGLAARPRSAAATSREPRARERSPAAHALVLDQPAAVEAEAPAPVALDQRVVVRGHEHGRAARGGRRRSGP